MFKQTLLLLAVLSVASLTTTAAADGAANQTNNHVIGIDLGTTYSCVGVWKNGRVEIIPNDQGNRITPSYVAFDGDERFIGDAAKNQASLNPQNTVFDVKRLIGRDFKDDTVQQDSKLLPFGIQNNNGKPTVSVSVKGSPKQFSPEEISAMVLTEMKQTAEGFLGETVQDAVVTVPAYFTDAQRQATKDAGAIAGLNVLRIINEPTAAAIAYGLDTASQDKPDKEKNVLVFDLGGGTFDVTLLTIDNGVFEVIATNGDTHLGGEDFDQRVMDYMMKVFKRKHGEDMSKDKRSIQKLRREVERTKRELSTGTSSRVEVDSLYNGISFSEPLTRARFEELNMDLFKRTLEPVKKVMDASGLRKQQVDEVVMVGGSTRIPKVQRMLSQFFNNKQLNHGVNPDEAVAYGAAVQGAILSGSYHEALDKMLLLDVAPLSLGIETVGGVMTKVIQGQTTIPAKKSQIFSTNADNQPAVTIQVYEGERAMCKDNHKLGQFELAGIPEAPRGVPQIEVTFDIDADGILNVQAEDKANRKREKITINNDKGRLSQEDIERMKAEAEQFAEEDQKAKGKAEARNTLENYMHTVKRTLSESGSALEEEEKRVVAQAVEEGLRWLEEGRVHADEEAYREKHQQLEQVCGPVVAKVQQQQQGGADQGPPKGQAQEEEMPSHEQL